MVHLPDIMKAAAWTLRAEGVSVRRLRKWIVRGLTWEHRVGRIAWIIGENGTGKTSLLRVLVGRARPVAGTVALLGPQGEAARRLYYHPGMHLPAHATVREWLDLTAALPGGAGVTGPGLMPAVPGTRRLGRLSTGEAKRLLLEALLHRPAPFVFLDEPYEHLSPDACAALTRILAARAATSVVVVATNQPVPLSARGPVLRLGAGCAVPVRAGEVAG